MTSLDLFVESALNGILLGGIYALAALGLSLVFGIMDIVNLAHGHLLMLGGYVAVILTMTIGLSPLIGMVVAIFVLIVVGLVLQELMQYVVEEDIEQPLLLLFGVALVIQNSWQYILDTFLFGSQTQLTDLEIVTGNVVIGGFSFSSPRVVAFGVSVGLIGLTWLLLQHTKVGRAIRATAQNPTAARYMGINTDSVYRITMCIGAALAGAAGAVLSILFPIGPYVGWSYLLKTFAVVVLGGVGSVIGTLVGGIVLGISENIGSLVIGGSYRDIVAFCIFLVVLILRPQGLLGTNVEGE